MGVVPDFRITADGLDRSDILKQRLLSINLTTTTGSQADELVLTFDDRDGAIVLPRHGAQLGIAIGYRGEALVSHGLFTVDETEIKGPPDIVEVRAKGHDMRASLKAHKNRSWRNTTVGDAFVVIASNHDLTAQVHPDLAAIQIGHRDQTGESDLHFATRLANDHDAIASVKGGKLIVAPKGAAVSASGKDLGDLQLSRTDLASNNGWRMVNSDRSKHGAVRARWRDMGAAEDKFEVVGAGDPVATLRHTHRSQAEAVHTAHARHMRMKREGHQVEVTLRKGDPNIFAGRAIVLSGIRDGIDGRWISTQVVHEIDWASKGYATGIQASVDGKSADTGDGTPGYGGDDADPSDSESDPE